MSQSAGIKVEEHLHLVHLTINRYLKKYLSRHEYDDLFQVGCEGLIKAGKRFDPSKGFTFSTYAVTCILGRIKLYNRDYRFIKEPRVSQELYQKMFYGNLLDQPIGKIAELTGSSITSVEKALLLKNKVVSTDKVVYQDSNDKMTIGELIPENDDLTSGVEVNDFLLTLKDREREVVVMRMQGNDQLTIAKAIGVSQPSIGRILIRSANKYVEFMKGA